MPTKFQRPLLLINSIRPGVTGTIDCELGRRYWDIQLGIQATGQVLNEIVDKFRIKIGTQVKREFTPDELEAELLALGEDGSTRYSIQNNVAGQRIAVPLWFMEPWRKGYQAQRAFCWATGGIEKMTIEIDFADTAHASLAVDALATFDEPAAQGGIPLPMGVISKVFEEDVDVNGATSAYKGLEKADSLQSITLHDPDIESVEFIAGGVTWREVTKEQVDARLKGLGMTPDADTFQIVFDDDDEPMSAMPIGGLKTVVLKLNLSDPTPRNIRAVVTRVGPWNSTP